MRCAALQLEPVGVEADGQVVVQDVHRAAVVLGCSGARPPEG